MKKGLILGVIAIMFIAVGCSKKADLSTEENKTFYAVGSMFGSRLATLTPTAAELDALAQGLRDAAEGKKPAVEINKYQRKVQELFRSRMSKNNEKVKKGGQEYFEKFLKEEGVKKTKSGLAYKIIKPGKGKTPKATDMVEVHYHGTLTDGTVFDSSVDRKKKVSFPLNRVIKGWTEGLQLIKAGGKIKLVIPSDLGYGDRGAPPKIPGGSTLVFDVELFSVKAAPKTPKKSAKKKAPKKKK